MSLSENLDALRSSLSSFQKELHISKGPEDPLTHPFLGEREKCSFYRTCDTPLGSKVDDIRRNVIVYDVATYPYHELLSTYIYTKTPRIRAREGYSIRFGPYPLLSQIDKIQMVFDGNRIIAEWNSDYFFSILQFKQPDERKAIEEGLGNVPALTEWSEELPPTRLKYIPPLFFSRGETSSFPLMLCGNSNKLQFIVIMRRELKNLLQIRKKVINEDGDISYIPENFDYRLITIDEGRGTEYCQVPEMWGKFAIHLDEQISIDYYRSRDFKFYYDTTVTQEARGTYQLQEEPVVEIPPVSIPFHTMFWMAKNLNAKKRNDYFNTTTNEWDSSRGFSPVDRSSFEIGERYLFSGMPSWNTEECQPFHLFKSYGKTKGVNVWSNDLIGKETLIPPGENLGGGKLKVYLASQNPIIDPSESDSVYQVVAILVGTSQFRFTTVQLGDDRETKLSSIQIGFKG